MPLPEPCRRAKALDATPPPASRMTAAPIGWVSVAEARAETSGSEARERTGTSSRARRPPALRRPISAPAAIACAGDAPVASRMRGKCAAMPAVTIQAAAKAKASRIIGRSIGIGLWAARAAVVVPVIVPWARGSRNQFIGRAMKRWTAAQARQVSRQPMVEAPNAVSGQPMVLAKPAIRVMPVIAPRASVP